MKLSKLIILLSIVALIGAFFWFDGQQYLSLTQFRTWVSHNALTASVIYLFFYVFVTALSIPGAAAITLIGGAVFGFWWGLVLVSFASSIGATLAFLLSRTLFADWVNRKFGHHLETVNRGIRKDGVFYLFSLRLIPIIPFFVINLIFGLTQMKTWSFYWASQLGMLAGTAVYVNAGAQLGEVEALSLQGIATPGIIGAFFLLAIFPYIVKALVAAYRNYKAYKNYEKPKHFDANLVVIGAGSAGLVSAYIAAAVKAKVVLIEKHKMGGDCLNTGCVPSKSLIRAAKIRHYMQTAHQLGIENCSGDVNFPKVMQRVHEVIDTIEPHDSAERYTKLGVDCVKGEARILSPWKVQVNDRIITTKNIIIASGARPFVPPIPGLDQVDPLTSDNLWSLQEQPKKLLLMGAGPIGCELAQAFQRLGTSVTIVDMADRLMPREDEDVSAYMLKTFENEGIEVHLKQKIIGFESSGSGYLAQIEGADGKRSLPFDRVIVAVGRRANTEGLGLDDLNIEITKTGTVQVDEHLRTRFPNIYACGDVAGPYQFTHTAAHQAWYASVNALFGVLKKFKVDYRVIPWATFTDPEVARVGLSETEARQKQLDYEVTTYGIDDLDRAIADNQAKGFVKVLTAKGTDRVLGCTIVGYHAGELITEFVSAMKHNIGLNKILSTIHIYPTLSEANKYAAGEWKRAHVSERTLRWVGKFHGWMRG
ncbi:MAG: dihydrolipoamide dehydrogenase [Cellvibrionaceae bacterium]|jgi:dihydrolipoamide dehydrogenase